MSYVDSILEPGEKVAFRTRLSWTLYAPAISSPSPRRRWRSSAPAFPGFGLYAAARRRADRARRGDQVRSRLVPALDDRDRGHRPARHLERGFIRRHTVEMNMQKVESVDVDQTQLGRLFDYGTVTIRGVGSTFESLEMVDAPLKLRTTITAG